MTEGAVIDPHREVVRVGPWLTWRSYHTEHCNYSAYFCMFDIL